MSQKALEEYQIDFSTYFQKDSPDDSCALTNYYVEKVTLNGLQIDTSYYDSVFSISDAGLFKINDFTKSFRTYQVYIITGNGEVNSTSYNLIDIEITQVELPLPNVAPYFITEPEAEILVLTPE